MKIKSLIITLMIFALFVTFAIGQVADGTVSLYPAEQGSTDEIGVIKITPDKDLICNVIDNYEVTANGNGPHCIMWYRNQVYFDFNTPQDYTDDVFCDNDGSVFNHVLDNTWTSPGENWSCWAYHLGGSYPVIGFGPNTIDNSGNPDDGFSRTEHIYANTPPTITLTPAQHTYSSLPSSQQIVTLPNDLWAASQVVDAESLTWNLLFDISAQTDTSIADCFIDGQRYITCTIKEGIQGENIATLQVSDGLASSYQDVTITVANAPVVTIDDLETNDTRPPLTGTVDDTLATLEVEVNTVFYTATNNQDGTWTLADDLIVPDLPDDVYIVIVIATGQMGPTATDTATLTIDTVAPIFTIDPLTTSDSTPTITGTIDDPTATITVTIDGNTYTATNNGDGTWTVDITNPLGDGSYDVTVTATDTAGNSDTIIETGIVDVDSTAPGITIDPLVTNDDTPEITGTIDDNGATITVTIDGSTYDATNNQDGTWTLADDTITPALTEGSYDITADVDDGQGNTDTITEIGIIEIDQTIPTGSLTNLDETSTTTSSIYWEWDNPADPDFDHVRIEVYLVGPATVVDTAETADSTIDYYEVTGLNAETDYRIRTWIVDEAGNEQTTYLDDIATTDAIDATGPTVNIDFQTTTDTTPTITGIVSEATTSITVVVGAYTYTATDNGGTWTVDVTDTLAQGTYDVQVTATDTSGNPGSDVTTDELIIDFNDLPTVNTILLESSAGTDTSVEDLWLSYTLGDADAGDNPIGIVNWELGGQSINVLNLPFEANDGSEDSTTFDYSTYANDGTITGATWIEDGDRNGNGAYSFDGNGDFITTPGIDITSGQITITGWFYSSDFARNMALVCSQNYNDQWCLYLSNGGAGQIAVRSRSSYFFLGAGMTDSSWNFIAATIEGTTARIYVNGALLGEKLDISPLASGSPASTKVLLGRLFDGYNGYDYDGLMDDIRVYDIALSEEQINNIYNNDYSTIVSQETTPADVWRACVTPNDGVADGTQDCSNHLSVHNSAPVADNIVTIGHNLEEVMIPLVYSDPDGDDAVSCTVSNLVDGVDSTPCFCDGNGDCFVGLTSDDGVDQVTANYIVSDGVTTSPPATIT
ncbi:Ig-like domain-containing protein, partial [Nanoarchaeota archaeon]